MMPWLWVVIGLISIWYADLLLLPAGVTLGRDAMSVYYPMAFFHRTALLSGQWPIWNPFVCAGAIPWIGRTPESDWCYPLNWLYLILPAAQAINWTVFLHLLLAGVGMFLWVYVMTRSGFGACVAGSLYSLGHYFLHRLVSGHLVELVAAAWMPWIFFCAWQALQHKHRGWSLLGGGLLGLQFLGGSPQSCWYTVVGLVVAMLLGERLVPARARLARLRWVGASFGLTVASAMGIAAVKWLPMGWAVAQSSRLGSGGMLREYLAFAVAGAVRPDGWLNLLLPNAPLQGSFHEYLGLTAVVLAGFAVALARGPVVRWCVGLLGVGVFFSLGGYNPLYAPFYFGMPGFAGFRRPGRALVLVCAAVAALAGIGASLLTQPSSRKSVATAARWVGRGAAGLFLLHLATTAVMAVVTRHTSLPDVGWRELLRPWTMPTWGVWLLGAGMGFVILARLRGTLTGSGAAGLVAVLLLADYGMWLNRAAVSYQDVRDYFRQSAVTTRMERDPDPGRILVTADTPWFHLNQGMVDRLASVTGAQSLIPSTYVRYLMRINGLAKPVRSIEELPWPRLDSPLLNLLGVKYVLTDQPVPASFLLLDAMGRWKLYRNPEAFPRAVVSFRAEGVATLEQALDRLDDPSFDARTRVLLTAAGENIRAGGGRGEAHVTWLRASLTRTELAVNTTAPGWLVLFDPYADGWQASVDGRRVAIRKADGIFRAIEVPAGRHQIAWVYRPGLFVLGSSVSVGSLCALIGAWRSRWS